MTKPLTPEHSTTSSIFPKTASSIDIREGEGVRTLHFGSEWVQGAMRVARPWALELEYTRAMIFPLILCEETPTRILLIGLGAASLLKYLYRHCPHAHLTVVEIDPSVVQAARQFFRMPEDSERITLVEGDGADFMSQVSETYDLILVDGFDARARAGRLQGERFYRDCGRVLSAHGFLCANLLTRQRGYRSALSALNAIFTERTLHFPTLDSGNGVVLASAEPQGPWSLVELRARVLTWKKNHALDLGRLLARIEQLQSGASGMLRLGQ
ncbi:MAG: fused MFS/spermidine synthase [Ferrovum myxofaciens]|uniref:fused MFS/spermidine synthase n=1 Tax=Ferrovum myxofaciens TaxID=416213 RepID=UPI0023555F41|nr:fused MFS/spermidine synthase [Ferrovum myxofaciens]QKE39910.1 MAG: fused MFS/spermidine synthase [Ferrovum myxofaciens]